MATAAAAMATAEQQWRLQQQRPLLGSAAGGRSSGSDMVGMLAPSSDTATPRDAATAVVAEVGWWGACK
jgi:hypothetical protein